LLILDPRDDCSFSLNGGGRIITLDFKNLSDLKPDGDATDRKLLFTGPEGWGFMEGVFKRFRG
jgi:hypothetical protein